MPQKQEFWMFHNHLQNLKSPLVGKQLVIRWVLQMFFIVIIMLMLNKSYLRHPNSVPQDDAYADGVLLSYNTPREYIWTFTAQNSRHKKK